MCTVVFIPGKSEYCFASLRDESPLRAAALPPEQYSVNEISYLSPKDSKAGGSWMGVTGLGHVIVLLNGGFENHSKQKVYRKSRGLIVNELLISTVPVVDWSIMDLEDIEPFTLIVWADGILFQLVWDGAQKHRLSLDSEIPHLWSSSTLYEAAFRTHRNELFNNWMAMDPPLTKLAVLNFFKSNADKENGFIINRGGKIQTLSYCFIHLETHISASMHYYDLINFKYSCKSLSLLKETGNCELPGGLLIVS